MSCREREDDRENERAKKEGGREGEIDGWEFDRDVEGKCAGDLWHLNSFT